MWNLFLILEGLQGAQKMGIREFPGIKHNWRRQGKTIIDGNGERGMHVIKGKRIGTSPGVD